MSNNKKKLIWQEKFARYLREKGGYPWKLSFETAEIATEEISDWYTYEPEDAAYEELCAGQ